MRNEELELVLGLRINNKTISRIFNDLGIQNESKDKPAYKKFFMHGTSHHLGLNILI